MVSASTPPPCHLPSSAASPVNSFADLCVPPPDVCLASCLVLCFLLADHCHYGKVRRIRHVLIAMCGNRKSVLAAAFEGPHVPRDDLFVGLLCGDPLRFQGS